MGQYENVHLTVVKNVELLEKIDKAGAAMFGDSNTRTLYGAPMLIIVSSKKPEDNAFAENVAYSNAAIIAHNMSLEATDLGVGSCYIWGAIAALATSPDIVAELNLPDGFIPCCAVVLGDTQENYELRDIRLDRISQNTIK